jgi:hypothetical protein
MNKILIAPSGRHASSPKLWAGRPDWFSHSYGECDRGIGRDQGVPGRFDAEANGLNGITGTIRLPDGSWTPRVCYETEEDWVADVALAYTGCEIIREF